MTWPKKENEHKKKRAKEENICACLYDELRLQDAHYSKHRICFYCIGFVAGQFLFSFEPLSVWIQHKEQCVSECEDKGIHLNSSSSTIYRQCSMSLVYIAHVLLSYIDFDMLLVSAARFSLLLCLATFAYSPGSLKALMFSILLYVIWCVRTTESINVDIFLESQDKIYSNRVKQ